ncbi:MAG TPA: menaquinone biosynthesis protein [Candidatus Acidoferrum sp.]|nr:menaquinone biosynthesis protein [Candidatus Acidoferrum sp.]
MKSLRISIVQYLNTAPLVRGLTHGPLRGKYELSFTVPSECAEALRTRQVDIAIIPAIEYQRIDGLVILPDLSIASKTSVRSLLLISKKPIQEVQKIALDRSSRSTQAMTKILCAKRWHIEPEYFEMAPDLPEMLDKADAALLIGDPALQFAVTGRRSAGKHGLSNLKVYDVVEKWRGLTNLPAVLAVWAGWPERIGKEVVQDFQDSLAFGMRHLDQISEESAAQLNLPATELKLYLTENINYRLHAENLRGLRRYYDLAAEIGIIPRAREIVMAEEAVKV